jgi:hypothetical protein
MNLTILMSCRLVHILFQMHIQFLMSYRLAHDIIYVIMPLLGQLTSIVFHM